MENTKMKLTGKPSIDKPWLQFYPILSAAIIKYNVQEHSARIVEFFFHPHIPEPLMIWLLCQPLSKASSM